MSLDRWPAPAKLNLFLHITGRRHDGYHLLQTLFQFLDYGDQLTLEPTSDGTICRRREIPGVSAEQDLTLRAARLLQQRSGCRQGVVIDVEKRLPSGGGLGGGSSDAATVLVILNRLWGLGFDNDTLAALGLQLGADVPLFVRGEAAWGEGVGELLTPVTLSEPWYLVIVPPVSVATAELFAAPELTRDASAVTMRDFVAGATCNVFETVVRQRYPAVDAAFDWLSRYGQARLTGSGGCLFLPLADQEQATAIWQQRPSGWRGFIARGSNRSPLQQRLEALDQ